MSVVVFLEGQHLQLAIAHIGHSEVLEDSGVRVSEVGVLHLEGGVVGSSGDQVLKEDIELRTRE